MKIFSDDKTERLLLLKNKPAFFIPFQVSTFIMMYRTHCQRILDTVIRANFDEVGRETKEL